MAEGGINKEAQLFGSVRVWDLAFGSLAFAAEAA
jgi:hypothetical protein